MIPKVSGIYCIRNIVNNKRYIGQAIDIQKRWREHRYTLRNNKSFNTVLQRAWNKYGESNFVFEILETLQLTNDNNTNKHLLTLYENDWYCYHYPDIYNCKPIVESMLGYKHTEETKQKIGSKSKGRIVSLEARNKMSIAAKRSKNHLGKIHSKEARQRISDNRKGIRPSNAFYEHTTKLKQKPIVQLNLLTGETIRIWDSIKIAGNTLYIDRSSITKVCQGKQNSAGGFKWEYYLVES